MNALNSALTEDIMLNVINGTYEYIATRDTILKSFNSRVDSLSSSIIFFEIFLFF